MTTSIETQIVEAEARLSEAMLNSDVSALDRLLAPELIFTNHLGQISSKQDDLNAHKSGMFKIDTLTTEELQIQVVDRVAIATVKVHLVGSYRGSSFDSLLRFTRVWSCCSDHRTWQIVAAHSCLVAN